MPLDSPGRLARLEAEDLLRSPPTRTGPQGPEVILDGRRVLCLCSNDYLGLAAAPELCHAAATAIAEHGLGTGASRLISGTTELHRRAESRLARFVGLPAALLFGSGYAANVGALQALASSEDVIFSDSLNHASLIDGCRLSRATVHVYQHCDHEHLASLLDRHRGDGRRALVVTDALFSMDGDAAPLPALRALCDRHDAALFVDEAHALGVLGPRGAGAAAAGGTRPDVLVGTLGKAFGVAGAFVAADASTIRWIENRARSFVFSTAPPAALAAAATRAADLVAEADDRRARLSSLAQRLRDALAALGLPRPPGEAHIIPLLIGDPRETVEMSRALLDRDVFVQAIRPPTVPPATSRLRIAPMATHTDAQLEHALRAFADLLQP